MSDAERSRVRPKVASVVLDSSALLALVNGEPGAENVAAKLGDALISAVNLAEAITRLVSHGGSLEEAQTVLALLDLDVVDFDRKLAHKTGGLVTMTRSRGLSLGDRACLALADREQIPAMTADRAWSGLDLGVEILLIR